MACPFNEESLEKLKSFIDLCTTRPEILHLPELAFFKKYLESLNAKIPEDKTPTTPMMEEPVKPPEEPKDIEEDSEPESDLELDTEGCIEPDTVTDLIMGDSAKIPSEEETDQADEKRNEAMSQFASGDFAKSLALLTEAIVLNPSAAVLFVKRGQTSLKLKKPNACIKDCTRALELNPDSAAGYKFRGRAYRLLGEWEKSAQDLRQACKIDFDEQTDEWLKEVTPNAMKIEHHRLKQERKKSEKEIKEKLERIHKAREAHAKAAQESADSEEGTEQGGAGLGDFYKIFKDPEVMAAFKDPEVAAAFQDISSNPSNFAKYQSNPKVMALIAKLSGKFQGSGFPGMGGFPPGFGGNFGGAAPEGEPKFTDEDILD